MIKLKKNLEWKSVIGISLFILSLFLILSVCLLGLNNTIWFDELWTLEAVHKSFNSMIFFIASDMHPPLYFIILKCVLDCNAFNFLSEYYIAKIVSILSILLLIIFSFVKIRKDEGWLVAGIFSFCIITMPKMMLYSFQIRMYSLGLLFTTLSFYYFYKIFTEHSKKNWFVFTFCSLLSVYTHYYEIIFISIMYFSLLIFIILKNMNLIKNWIISAITVFLTYLPWVIISIKYSKYFKSDFSNGQYVQDAILIPVSAITYIFTPVNIYLDNYLLIEPGLLLLGLILFLILFTLFINYIFKKEMYEKKSFLLICGGFFVLITTIMFLGIFSILIHPIFNARYIFPIIGLLWLSFATLLSQYYSKKVVFIPILVIVLTIGIFNVVSFTNSEIQDNRAMLEFESYLDQVKTNDTIIFIDWKFLSYSFQFYSKNYSFTLNQYYIPTIKDNYSLSYYYSKEQNFIPIEDISLNDIKNMLKKGKIWVLDMENPVFNPQISKLMISNFRIDGFNNTLNENGLYLNKFKKLTNSRSYYYPHTIYSIDYK